METQNYLKYKTLCPIPPECLQRNERFESNDRVLNPQINQNTDIGVEPFAEKEGSLEKKQAIGQFVTVLQKIVLQQQKQQSELIAMLRNKSVVKTDISFLSDVAARSQVMKKEVKREDSAEEKLKKAEQRVQELEALLKQMEVEKQNTNGITNANTENKKVDTKENSAKDKKTKKAELLNKVLKSTKEITIDPQIQRQNETQIAALRNPYRTTKGILYKKISVTWNTIYFGHYPSQRLSDTWLKTQLEKNPKLDTNGNYVYGEKIFRKNIRDFYEYQPICWRVLDIKNGVATLFAEQILDVMPYHAEKNAGTMTWGQSSLRQWLNEEFAGSFYDLAFSETEKAAIVKNQATQERVTLLRQVEIENPSYASYGFYDMKKGKDISYIESRNSSAYTDYAEGKSISRKDTMLGKRGAWWLKDTVGNGRKAVEVKCQGFIDVSGIDMSATGVGVRPVIVVDLKKLNEVIELGNSVETIRV